MRLADRLLDRYRAAEDRLATRDVGYYEGMASGASVLYEFNSQSNRESSPKDLIQAAKQQYQTNGVVFACVLVRQMILSEATFKFRSQVDKHMFGSQDLRILERPWPNATSGELWAKMELDFSLAGNSYWWKAADDLLVHLPPHEVTIVSQEVTDPAGRKYREIIGYDWDPGLPPPGQPASQPTKEPAQHFTVDEIAHWSPLPDPAAQFRGMSWLSPIFREVDADSAFTHYKAAYVTRGQPVTVLKYAARLRSDTIDSIIDRLQKKYGGVANAWKPLILDQGADPVVGAALKDMDFRSIQAGGEERICAAAGVPPVIIGLADAQTGESYQQAVRSFVDFHIRPLWRSGCAALVKLVPNVPDQGIQLWYDTSDIAALQAAETERAQVIQVNGAAILTLIQAGFTRESVVAAVTAGDLSQLVPDPNAPTPGVAERETITAPALEPVTGPGSGSDANATTVDRPAKTGSPPGGGQVLTKPQTPATKKPMPGSLPTQPSSNGKAANPTPNRG